MKTLREKYLKNMLNNQTLKVKKWSFRARKRFYRIER